jgi:putative hemolysin
MDPSSSLSFLALLVLLAFFAGTEIPLMSVSAHKLESFKKLARPGSKSLRKILKDPERLLIVNLIGTTIVTIAISSLSTVVAIEMASSLGLSGEQAVAAVIFVASAVILLFGEIAPKIIGVRYADSVALAVAPMYRFLMFVCTPLNFLIHFFVRFIGFLTGGKVDIHSKKMSQEELEAFIDLSHASGAVESHEHKKIKGVLDLAETEAGSVMTPRVKVDFVSMEATVDETIDILLESSHTRLPISGENTDDVDYVVTLREVLAWKKEGLGSKKLSELDLEKIIKVPLTKPLDQIFETFQKSRKHIALVMDEYGGVAGVITLEDIVEEVF